MRIRYFSCVLLLALNACDYMPSWMGGSEKEVKRLPGEREDVLKTGGELSADQILQQVQFKIPDPVDNASWPQAGGNFTAATGNIAAKGDLSSKESVSVGEGNKFTQPLVPRPVAGNGKLFAMDAEGYISAHDVANIKQKYWVSSALVTKNEDEVIGGGFAVDGGKLYAVSGLGRVAALDETSGSELWHRDLGVPLRSAPRVAFGRVFVTTIDSQLYALDIADGKVLWTHRGIGETAGLMNNVTPSVVSDLVIVPYASGEVYGLKNDTGDEVWRAAMAQAKRTEATAIFSGIGGDLVVDEQVIFAASNGGSFMVLNVLNGQPLWEKKVASINTPWLVGEYIFAISENNELVAMVKYDGRIRWSTQLKRFEDEIHKLKPIIWRGPVMVAGKLVVVSNRGEMLFIEGADGSVSSTVEVSDDITTAPIVVDGKVFLVGKDAKLISYQ